MSFASMAGEFAQAGAKLAGNALEKKARNAADQAHAAAMKQLAGPGVGGAPGTTSMRRRKQFGGKRNKKSRKERKSRKQRKSRKSRK
jgi:hypothetical protein